jgi:hypothetical protein
MKLPFLHRKSENEAESYCGIFLQEDKVTGFVYELLATKIHILAQHTSAYTNGMENVVEDIDDILFRLETDTNKKLSKTIFFVTSFFLDEDSKQIKKEFKAILKKITHELELQALGFIECYEAVAALIAKKEGVHLNLVLVELDQTSGHVFIYKNDKQIYSSFFERSEHLINDLTKQFTHVKGQFMLPPRIILYPHTQSHKHLVNLTNHSWSEELFMHIPKVEAISEDELFTGFADIFYTQLKDDSAPETPERSEDSSLADSALAADAEQSEPLQAEKDEDVESSIPEEDPREERQIEDDQIGENPKNVMGFAIGADVTADLANPSAHESLNEELSRNIENQESSEEITADRPSTKSSKKFALTGLMASIKNAASKVKLPLKTQLFIPIGAVVIILLLFLGSEFFLHKEVVHVSFPTKNITKDLSFSSDELDIKTGDVAADVSDSITTTGKKDIGEKAKGEVSIRNFDDTEKTFSKGSVLSANSKNFILDQDVKVASASVSSDNSSKIAGEAKGSVTADSLGPDYNLDKNTKFHIDDLDFSTFFAINESAFSGGTKRQAQTVSQKDINDLKAKVLNAGEKQGLDKMRAEVSKDQQIIDSLTSQELANVDFSKEVGDEAKTVSVKANVATTYYTYSEDTLKKKIQDSLKSSIPEGYSLPLENIQPKIKDATKAKNTVTLSISASGKSIKQVSKEDVIAAIKGKSKNSVESILKDTFQAENTTVEDKGLTFFPWMPLFKNNITVEVSSL